jgi:uncharacterized protein (TIGR03086 family)
MDLLPMYERAAKNTAAIASGTTTDQLSDPTPCTDWDCRAVLNHMIGTNYMWAALAAGEEVEAPASPPDFVGDDPGGAYQKSVDAALAGFKSPSVENTWKTPVGEMPGAQAMALAVFETVVHGWDLATGTGQDPESDPDLAEAVHQMAQVGVLPEYREPPISRFGPELEPAADASATERLMAFLGRSV